MSGVGKMKNYKDNILKEKLKELKNIREFLFEKKYIKTNKFVAELGEYFASKILNLNLNIKNNEKGYDALDLKKKKVEIKTRQEHSRNQDPYIYRGFKDPINFNYLLIVLLDENYWVKSMWKLTKRDVVQIRTKTGNINFKKNAKNRAEKLYPN